MKNLVVFFGFGSLFLATTVSKAADAFVISNLNFRAGPSTQYTLRGLIPVGTLVFVQTCRENWCQIRYNTQTGWVSSRYLSFKDGNAIYNTYAMLPITNHNTYNLTLHNGCSEYHNKSVEQHHSINERNDTNNHSCRYIRILPPPKD
ncbi:SH3 domain-containing protein [Bartonella heixiaziensis]|uniref:SH3 domain-containing protein n=1 Tax=Bartonella heixiaziensis TaxID=1461000 RepID=UPI003D1E1280